MLGRSCYERKGVRPVEKSYKVNKFEWLQHACGTAGIQDSGKLGVVALMIQMPPQATGLCIA